MDAIVYIIYLKIYDINYREYVFRIDLLSMQYLQPFLIALVISVGIVFLILRWDEKGRFKKFFLKNRKTKRHIHKKNISRLGGVAIILAFIITILIDKNLVISNVLWGMILGSLIILVVGVWDDFKEIDWRWQLFFQIIAVGFIFLFGAKINYISNPFGEVIHFDTPIKMALGILLGIVWSLILMNALNWLDGIDGLSGGISLIAIIAIFLLALKPEVNQPPVAIIAMAFAGGLLGFLLFNFYPAKIMAGTSGAFFMGFILAGLSIFAGTKIATTLLVLTIPVLDFFWVVGERIKSGKSIFEPDQKHLHHRLLKLGWSQKKIVLFFCAITLIIAGLALTVSTVSKIILVFLFSMVMFFVYNKLIVLLRTQKR